jgi:hypothetical protein
LLVVVIRVFSMGKKGTFKLDKKIKTRGWKRCRLTSKSVSCVYF